MAGEQIYAGHSLAECLDIVKQKLKLKASFRGKLPKGKCRADIILPKSFSQYQ